MNGNNILVFKDGVAIAAAKSCSISKKTATIEVASQTQGVAKEFIPSLTEWEVSVKTLVTSVKSFFEHPGDSVRLSLVIRDNNGNYTTDRVTGEALIVESHVTGTWGNLASAEVRFLGTGALERPVVRLRDNQGTPLNDSQGNHLFAIGQI